MVNIHESVKSIEHQAVAALQEALEKVPAVVVEAIELQSSSPDDIRARIHLSDRSHTLLCKIENNGQPRLVRMASLVLRDRIERGGIDAVPILIAPYLSPASRAICEEYGIGFLDLVGNARIAFDSVFIDRTVADKPPSERRTLQSLLGPKATRVLLVMLRDPPRAWRVAELAEAAGVSLGHASNLRRALIEREWAGEVAGGAALLDPDALLDTWRDGYRQPAGRRLSGYTYLHGGSLDAAVRDAFGTETAKCRAIFASFSAARWLAPYGRHGTDYFYADEDGAGPLMDALHLSSATQGDNVEITIPKDTGILESCVEPALGIFCTNEIRTYLDLYHAGERGREAAEHLRREKLQWRRQRTESRSPRTTMTTAPRQR